MERNEELSLVDAVAIIRRRWWLIIAAALVCAVVTFLYFRRQTPLYHAESVLLIDTRTAARISAAAGQNSTVQDPKRILTDQVEFAKGALVRDEVRNRVGGAIDVSVSGSEDSDVLVFGATDPDPARAALVVNTYVAVHQQFTADQAAAAYAEALAGIDEVLLPIQQRLAELAPLTNAAALSPTAASAAGVDPTLLAERKRLETELASLETKKNGVRVSAGLDKDVVTKVISQGTAPDTPFTPRTKRNAVLGGMAGIVLSLALVFMADYLDDRLRDRAAIAKAVPRLPTLALIPRDRRAARSRGSMAAEPGAVGEAVRGLRTGVQFAGLSQTLRSLLVTSARPREGKSTIASSLAVALASSGTPTVLIDADLRKPRIHKLFGAADNSTGLSSVLHGHVPLASTLRNAPGVENLVLLPAGPSPDNAADLLWPGGVYSARVTIKTVVDELTNAGYLVVIDAPPVLPVADALTVSRAVDGVVFVLAAGSARERDVTRAFELLGQAGANVIGVAVNKLTRSGGGYGYGYGHGYGEGGGGGSNGTGAATGGRRERGTTGATADPAGALDLVDLRAAVGAAGSPEGVASGPGPEQGTEGYGAPGGLRNPLSGNGSV